MAGTYYRVQPAGDELLDVGYVLAFATPEQVVRCLVEWLAADVIGSEVTVFEGDDAYDPGDYESVAVSPVREIERVPFLDWVQRYGTPDDVERYQATERMLNLDNHLC